MIFASAVVIGCLIAMVGIIVDYQSKMKNIPAA